MSETTLLKVLVEARGLGIDVDAIVSKHCVVLAVRVFTHRALLHSSMVARCLLTGPK